MAIQPQTPKSENKFQPKAEGSREERVARPERDLPGKESKEMKTEDCGSCSTKKPN